MHLYTILLIGTALAMDSFAVSITSGMVIKPLKPGAALRIAGIFALFHALMPAIGWLGGIALKEIVEGFDHWVAFFLLAFVGAHMIHDALGFGGKEHHHDPLDNRVLLILAVATSIDALAVGFTFALIGTGIIAPVIIISCIIFATSMAGVYIGKRAGRMLGRRMELAGGIVLIAIGLRILIEHS